MSTLPAQPSPTRSGMPRSAWRSLAHGGASAPEIEKEPRGLDAAWVAAEGWVRAWLPRRALCMHRARRVERIAGSLESLEEAELCDEAERLRSVCRRGRDGRVELDRGLAVAAEAARRTLGFRVHRAQIAAALAMEAGCLAEQATGEGKTVSAALAATIAGWRGGGCHIVTVNDYLARRDAEWMGPVYEMCGVTVGCVQGDSDAAERRAAYAADVTYCTNKEVTADYLRDRLALGRTRDLPTAILDRLAGDGGADRSQRVVMRGLRQAIVDEADSVLIDEAVTPLIISSESSNEQQRRAYEQASDLAEAMDPQRDFTVDRRWREVRLTRSGRDRLAELTEPLGGIWAGQRRAEELVTQALTARHLYENGQQYVVRDGRVVIVDEFTGRLMPDRSWRAGLHQAVEAKEGLEVTAPKQTLTRLSFQRFFRRYQKLAGMTGTAAENRAELWQTYRLPVAPIPTHRRCIRTGEPAEVWPGSEQRWAAVVERVRREHEKGRPVLVGTRSVEASEHLSALLEEAGLAHQVLNAVRHEQEAAIVAEAGQPGRITVATNMAGRGTDIKLGESVAERGGLCVIATERHEARRIDRQLFGRAGRQGDPGTAVAVVSAEDELVRRYAPAWMRPVLRGLAGSGNPLSQGAARLLLGRLQRRAERAGRRQRRGVLRSDEWLDEHLSFTGADV